MVGLDPDMVGNTEKDRGQYPELGDIVSDRYRVLQELGKGGMGRVFLVEHVIIGKRAALKVLAPEWARDARLSTRFLQEARIASQIRHENVVDINDFGTTSGGLPFFVMDYLEGTDLDRMVRAHGYLPWLRARNIIRQVCVALKAAHDIGIVHRDIKPENVFVSSGSEDRVTVLDFGIAKIAASSLSSGDGHASSVTRDGAVVGTPAYMSPEQAQGLPVDLRTDVYATGCLLFYMLTGRTPFVAPTDLLMLHRHLTEAPQLPSMARPDAHIPEVADFFGHEGPCQGSCEAVGRHGRLAVCARIGPRGSTGDGLRTEHRQVAVPRFRESRDNTASGSVSPNRFARPREESLGCDRDGVGCGWRLGRRSGQSVALFRNGHRHLFLSQNARRQLAGRSDSGALRCQARRRAARRDADDAARLDTSIAPKPIPFSQQAENGCGLPQARSAEARDTSGISSPLRTFGRAGIPLTPFELTAGSPRHVAVRERL